MPAKIKFRPAGQLAAGRSLKPLLQHDVANFSAPANSAARRGAFATQPASGSANHSRHHVSRHTQS